MTVYELKKWLELCNDNDEVKITYICSDDYYNYYGSVHEIYLEDTEIILKVERRQNEKLSIL